MAKIELSDNIKSFVTQEYGADSSEVIELRRNYVQKPEWISHEKVIYSILKLANGRKSELIRFLRSAELDPRDVIMWADEISNEL